MPRTFGSPPRYFDQSEIHGYLRVIQPEWLALIVQVNTLLFKPGNEDNPAVFLYSLDPTRSPTSANPSAA